MVLLESWKSFEQEHGTPADVEKVQAMMPIVSRKRRMVGDNGDNEEECKCPFVLFFNSSPSPNKYQNNLFDSVLL